MFDFLNGFISLDHLNVLFVLGLSVFGGTIGGRLFQKMKIPQVVGYIIIGIIIGQSGLKIVSTSAINTFEPFNSFALGLIGFMIGKELQLETFKRFGKQFTFILFFEALGAFIFVSTLVFFAAFFILKDIKIAFIYSILLGAISSATAAAGTTDVLWEYKSKGSLTTTILGIVALDDILALFLFAVSSSIATILLGKTDSSILANFLSPLYEIGGALLLGCISGFGLSALLKRYTEEDKIMTFSISSILLILGLSTILKIDMILSSMMMGAIISNTAPIKSKSVFNALDKISPPIYILFFVMVGAKLNIGSLNTFLIIIAVIFLIGRSSGKMLGSTLGAKFGGASDKIRKYLPFCLFSQSGVAIGLSIIASQKFSATVGGGIIIIVTITTFIVQIIGPLFIRYALINSEEAGLNVTEEDIMKKTKISEVISKACPIIEDNMKINKILKLFSETNNLSYPVVNRKKELVGVITIENIRNLLTITDLDELILAYDLMEPVQFCLKEGNFLYDAKVIFDRESVNYIPIVNEKNIIRGFFESDTLKRMVSKKMIETQLKAE